MTRKCGHPRLKQDLKTHPNLKLCRDMDEHKLYKKLVEIHKFLQTPNSLLIGYVYQRLLEKKDVNTKP